MGEIPIVPEARRRVFGLCPQDDNLTELLVILNPEGVPAQSGAWGRISNLIAMEHG